MCEQFTEGLTLSKLCVCGSATQVSAVLFSYRGHSYLNLHVSSSADSRPSARERAMAHSPTAFYCVASLNRRKKKAEGKKKNGKAREHKVWRCKWPIKCIPGNGFIFTLSTPSNSLLYCQNWSNRIESLMFWKNWKFEKLHEKNNTILTASKLNMRLQSAVR